MVLIEGGMSEVEAEGLFYFSTFDSVVTRVIRVTLITPIILDHIVIRIIHLGRIVAIKEKTKKGTSKCIFEC